MVKVKFGKEQYEHMKKFENIHHPDIWKWVLDKLGKSDNISILDVSEEACVFALTLAENHPNNKLTVASRGKKPDIVLPANVTFHKTDFKSNYNDLSSLGKFDLIIVNEISHEIENFATFFGALKSHLAAKGQICLFSRPKNPPLPVPEVCHILWKKYSPNKEDLLDAAHKAEFSTSSFSAAIPCSVDRTQWENILYSGSIPAVKHTPKCDESTIRNFINSKSGRISFEEKLNIVLLKE